MTLEEKAGTPMRRHPVVEMFMLSNLGATTTGIPGAVIWFSAGEFVDPEPHVGPRLIVMLGDMIKTEGLIDVPIVRLTSPPDVLGELPASMTESLVRFVNLNREILLAHWEGELGTKETIRLLKAV